MAQLAIEKNKFSNQTKIVGGGVDGLSKENLLTFSKNDKNSLFLQHTTSCRPLEDITNRISIKDRFDDESTLNLGDALENRYSLMSMSKRDLLKFESDRSQFFNLKKDLASILHTFRTQLIRNYHKLRFNEVLNIPLFDDLYDILTNIEDDLSDGCEGEYCMFKNRTSSPDSRKNLDLEGKKKSENMKSLKFRSKSAGSSPIRANTACESYQIKYSMDAPESKQLENARREIEFALLCNTKNQIDALKSNELRDIKIKSEIQEELIKGLRRNLDELQSNPLLGPDSPVSSLDKENAGLIKINNEFCDYDEIIFESKQNFEEFLIKDGDTKNDLNGSSSVEKDKMIADHRNWNKVLITNIDKLNSEKTELYKTIERLIWEKKEMGDKELALKSELFEIKSSIREMSKSQDGSDDAHYKREQIKEEMEKLSKKKKTLQEKKKAISQRELMILIQEKKLQCQQQANIEEWNRLETKGEDLKLLEADLNIRKEEIEKQHTDLKGIIKFFILKECFHLLKERSLIEGQSKMKELAVKQTEDRKFNEKLVKTFILKECFLKLKEKKIQEKEMINSNEKLKTVQEIKGLKEKLASEVKKNDQLCKIIETKLEIIERTSEELKLLPEMDEN